MEFNMSFPKELNKENGIIIKNDIEYEFGICDGNAKGWYREFENFVSNDKNGVHYYNCFNSKNTVTFYPSYLGADCEITFKDDVESNQVDFWLNVDSSMILKEEQGGYITINQIERDNILSFDITNEVIKWAEDTSGQMEHNGVLLKQQDELSGKGSVFLSNDNTLYRNFTEVILYN